MRDSETIITQEVGSATNRNPHEEKKKGNEATTSSFWRKKSGGKSPDIRKLLQWDTERLVTRPKFELVGRVFTLRKTHVRSERSGDWKLIKHVKLKESKARPSRKELRERRKKKNGRRQRKGPCRKGRFHGPSTKTQQGTVRAEKRKSNHHP